MTTCSEAGCDMPVHTRTVCMKHYHAARRAGTDHLLPRRPVRLCSEAGCESRHYCQGFCVKHYQRMRARGTTDAREMPALADRMAQSTERTASCWRWLGSEGRNGYGRISVDNVVHYAHRISYELANGPIPDDMTIDHLCRNRMCVNPDHMEIVTRAENGRRGSVARWEASNAS